MGPAILLALAAHLLVLLLLGWKIPRLVVRSRKDEGPVVQVTLLRPEAPLRRPTSAERTAPTRSSVPATSARVLTAPAAQAPLTTPQAPPQVAAAPVPPNLETSPDGDRLRSALRGLIGCTGALGDRLSHEEREACARKLAAAKPAPTGPLYSAREAAAFNTNPAKESIFVRKPHNECLPHIGSLPAAGGAAAPVSGAATTAFGIACEWDFW